MQAPAHFEAMQTYRAVMAVILRQMRFVRNMYESGVLDKDEMDTMINPIKKRRQILEVDGLTASGWQKADDVLLSLPMFSCLPVETANNILHGGVMKEFDGNEIVWNDSNSLDHFAFAIVVRGLVKNTTVQEDGSVQEKYMGSGSILGLVPALTEARTHLPGWGRMVAQSGRLQKGVLVFFLPMRTMNHARLAAKNGDQHFQTMVMELHKLAALQILDSLKFSVIQSVASIWRRVAEEHILHEEEVIDENEEIESIGMIRENIRTASEHYGAKVERAIRKAINTATVVALEPYQTYTQRSHIILLQGDLQSQKSNVGRSLRKSVSMGPKISAPHIFPFLSKKAGPLGVQEPKENTPYLSGHQGAVLIVCEREKSQNIDVTRYSNSENSFSIFDQSYNSTEYDA